MTDIPTDTQTEAPLLLFEQTLADVQAAHPDWTELDCLIAQLRALVVHLRDNPEDVVLPVANGTMVVLGAS